MNRSVRTGFTLVELLVVIAIIGVLAVMLFPRGLICSTPTGMTCKNNLRQLWTVHITYISVYGGRDRAYACDPPGQDNWKGERFWSNLMRLPQPLIEGGEILDCPVSPFVPAPGKSEYRGPSGNVNEYRQTDVVGADAPGAHGAGQGGTVLRKSSDVMNCSEDDRVWIDAGRRVMP